jgi:hypothetical protein
MRKRQKNPKKKVGAPLKGYTEHYNTLSKAFRENFHSNMKGRERQASQKLRKRAKKLQNIHPECIKIGENVSEYGRRLMDHKKIEKVIWKVVKWQGQIK